MFRIPEFFRPSLSLLPRPALGYLEIGAVPNLTRLVLSTPPPGRVALIKGEYCSHIYGIPGDSTDLKALALGTLKTFGPLSLFTRYPCDFRIVKLDPAPECQVWREFFAHDEDWENSRKIHENFRNLRPEGFPSSHPTQGELAVSVDEIDWDAYSAVIVQDFGVPERIVRKHPAVFWSFWISETGSPCFKQAYRRPLAGYQVFLNGGSRRWRVRPSLQSHALEFPYILQDFSTHQRLGAKAWEERSGILLEVNTARTIPVQVRRRLEDMAVVRDNIGSPAVRLELLHGSRYFLQMVDKPLWGNSLNEASAAGCLCLANPASMPNNLSLLTRGTTAGNWEEMIRMVRLLNNQAGQGSGLWRLQQLLASYFLHQRPLAEWEKRWDRHRKEKRL
jgi:hypothetical protein